MHIKKKINLQKNNIKLKPIVLVVLCTLFTSAGQIFFKISSRNLDSVMAIITNVPLYLGFLLYAIGALLMIISLKYGELSVIYPFISLSFVWVNILSIMLFGEFVSIINGIGVLGIIIGVSLIGYGTAKRTSHA